MEKATVPSYPSMGSIASLWPGPQVMLGRRLFWTEKRDGSQLKVWMDEGALRVATHHQEIASAQFRGYFEEADHADAVKELVSNRDSVPGVSDFGPYMVFGELLVKGKSPARYETHTETEFVVFDLYDLRAGVWLPVPLAYQTCCHFSVPFVEVWGESEHTTLDSLFAFRDSMLALAVERGREGVVVKTLTESGPLYAKEKRDALPVVHRSIEKGTLYLPPLPDSEVLGAVAKVHADLGDDFPDRRRAMPMVAKYVGEEAQKHLCGKPAMPLFWYYTHYLEGLASEVAGGGGS